MFDDVEEVIERYDAASLRHNSWSLFFHFFNDASQDHEFDSVHLVAYLASWGMYRGSSKLLKLHNYTVHDTAIKIVRQDRFANLSAATLATYEDAANRSALMTLIVALKDHYRSHDVTPTDTLITKVLMGCLACVPAFDRNFVLGVQAMPIPIATQLNEVAAFIGHLQEFPIMTLRCHQGRDFPFFKLVDMYFFQKGFETEKGKV